MILVFPSETISLITSCVRSSNLGVLWNGAKTDHFTPSRGLRQGDALSPYLFVLFMEKLSLSIQHKVLSGIWKPIHVSKGGPQLSHILFADDVMLFCEASIEQVKVVIDTLDEFFSASGLRINTFKSKAMCSRMVQGEIKQEIQDISTIKFVADLGHYLGFPLVKGRVSRNVYNDVVDKVSKRLSTGKGNILNKARRAYLVKSVTTAIPVHTMQLHYLPTYVCNRLVKMEMSFLWGGNGLSRTWNYVHWNMVTTPKRFGGLGIREARLTNLALLGKLVWNKLHNKDKFWVKVLSHKYMGKKSVWMNKKHNTPSITWRGIQHAITNFSAGYSFRVGSGDSSIWNIDWTQLGPLCQLVPLFNISDSVMCLKDVWNDGRWNLQGLATMIPTDIV